MQIWTCSQHFFSGRAFAGSVQRLKNASYINPKAVLTECVWRISEREKTRITTFVLANASGRQIPVDLELAAAATPGRLRHREPHVMPDSRRHRGPHPEDLQLFSAAAEGRLRLATEHLTWLLDRGYAENSALKLVGDRFELTARQRKAVSRCVCTEAQKLLRQSKQVSAKELADQPLWIDGYNVLISLEAALARGVLIAGNDGCLRDMASMHGSYRKVEETIPAIQLVGEFLAAAEVSECVWLIDQPVSNSGRLRGLIEELSTAASWSWQAQLVPDPDPILAAATCCVATADSAILDRAGTWFNLVSELVRSRIPEAWIVDLSHSEGGTNLNSM